MVVPIMMGKIARIYDTGYTRMNTRLWYQYVRNQVSYKVEVHDV